MKQGLAYLLWLAAGMCLLVAGLSIYQSVSAGSSDIRFGQLFGLAVLSGALWQAGQYVRKR